MGRPAARLVDAGVDGDRALAGVDVGEGVLLREPARTTGGRMRQHVGNTGQRRTQCEIKFEKCHYRGRSYCQGLSAKGNHIVAEILLWHVLLLELP